MVRPEGQWQEDEDGILFEEKQQHDSFLSGKSMEVAGHDTCHNHKRRTTSLR